MPSENTSAAVQELPEVGGAAGISVALQGGKLGDYVSLTKPEITFLVVLSAVAGFFLGSPGDLDTPLLLISIAGVGLTSAGAGTLNHYLERDRDGGMRRTASRPLPAGRILPHHARNFGIGLTGAGLAILCPLVNPLTAVLAALTVALYLFVYTPMKTYTTLNTLVGTIPGALPVIGGYAAATNSVTGEGAWLLFALLLFWQMPHFLALAWMYRKDYGRGGFAMLPVRDLTGGMTAFQICAFTVAMIMASLLLAWRGQFESLFAALAVAAAIIMVRPVVSFARSRSNADARRVLKASVLYIPMIVLAILLDRLV